MGHTAQRIEILLIGVVLIFGTAIGVGMWWFRPTTSTYDTQVAQPLGATATAIAAQVSSIPVPPTTSQPSITDKVQQALSNDMLFSKLSVLMGQFSLVVQVLPWLAATMLGLILLLIRRKRRMGYTNQTLREFLTASSPEVRKTTLRVLTEAAHNGVLTKELAEQAGIDILHPERRMLHSILVQRLRSLPILRLQFSSLRLPIVLRFKQAVALKLAHRPIVTSTQIAAQAQPVPVVAHISFSERVAKIRKAKAQSVQKEAEGNVLLHGVFTAQQDERIEFALPSTSKPAPSVECAWSAEDRVLAVSIVLADIWASAALNSPIIGLDTAEGEGNGQVIVSIDQRPNEEDFIGDIPQRIRKDRPDWQVVWRRDLLVIDVVVNQALLLTGGPLLAPALLHGRGNKIIRFFPLASHRHIGIYGADALSALHAMLGSLLYTQPPQRVALLIIDQGQIAPLYRDVAHLAPRHSSAQETLEELMRALKLGNQGILRPLLLVVVEPDDSVLHLLLTIEARLRTNLTLPVHLVIVQSHLSAVGQELYAMMPALITSGGTGSVVLLPGQGDWPKQGQARLIGRGLKVEGKPVLLNENEIARTLAPVRGVISDLLPTILDVSLGSNKHRDEEGGEQSDDMEVVAFPTVPIVLNFLPASIDEYTPTTIQEVLPRDENGSWLGAIIAEDVLPRAEQVARMAPQPSTPDNDSIEASMPAPHPEPDNGWPCGPAPIGQVALAALMGKILTTEAIISGDANTCGISKNRLVELLALTKTQARDVAEALMVWFDIAGLLVEPTKPGRLRHPRALTTIELEKMCRLLNETPLPDVATIRAAWAASNEGL